MLQIYHMFAGQRPLTWTGLAMIPVLIVAILGLFFDSRVITGAPAWMKPAKFAISIAIYCFTLAWIFNQMDRTRFTRIAGWVVGVVFLIEMAIIVLQAARGTSSHFNVSTSLNAILFSIMGGAILILWLASIAVTVALFFQVFPDPMLAWSLRLGMLIAVLGAGIGGLMPPRMAHTIGGPDGGPGLPITGWSTQYGDLRVPHFFGMHAMQIFPFLGWVLGRTHHSTLWVQVAALLYLGVLAFLTWSAFRGRPLLTASAATAILN